LIPARDFGFPHAPAEAECIYFLARMFSNLRPVDGIWLPDIGQELVVKLKRSAGDADVQEASSRKFLVLDGQVMLLLDFTSR
jgi:hypothetical protein